MKNFTLCNLRCSTLSCYLSSSYEVRNIPTSRHILVDIQNTTTQASITCTSLPKCCLIIAVKLNELEKDIDNILDWGIGDCKEMIQEILQAIHKDKAWKAKKLHEAPGEEAQQAAEK